MRRHAAVVVVAIVGMLALVLSPLEAAPPKRDYAAPSAAWSILPPGENGSLPFDRNTTDQEKLYDGLTPLRGAVTQRDLRRPSSRSSRFQATAPADAAGGIGAEPR